MNYRVAQSISLNALDKEPYSISQNGPIEIRIYVSSKAPLFCFYCFDKKGKFYPNGGWKHPVPLIVFPNQIQELFHICARIINVYVYKQLKDSWFN